MKRKSLSREQQWVILLLGLAILLGGVVRFAPTLSGGFPVNDGGMFYSAVQDLIDNHFVLPEFMSYNHLYIPFIYPPFGFYVAGLFAYLFNIDLLEIFRFLPALVSMLTIPIFFLLASKILKSRVSGSLATILYALLPRSMAWLIMGGGLTRGFGMLFFLLALYNACQMFSTGSRKYILFTSLSTALGVLAHPETTVYLAMGLILTWFFMGRTRTGFAKIFIAGFVSLLFVLPFELFVIQRHGLEPLLSASRTGGHSWFFVFHWLTGSFSEEPFISIITVLSLIGLAVQVARKDYYLPLFLLLPAIVQPRSQANIAVLPIAMLAAIGLTEIVLPGLMRSANRSRGVTGRSINWYDDPSRLPRIVIGFLVFISFFYAFYYSTVILTKTILGEEDRTAFEWVSEFTPVYSSFLVITGCGDWFLDPVNEWFPSMTGRTSLTTVQGKEWIYLGNFSDLYAITQAGQRCIDSTDQCLLEFAGELDAIDFDYIYISTSSDKTTRSISSGLAHSLLNNSQFSLVYATEQVQIYSFANP